VFSNHDQKNKKNLLGMSPLGSKKLTLSFFSPNFVKPFKRTRFENAFSAFSSSRLEAEKAVPFLITFPVNFFYFFGHLLSFKRPIAHNVPAPEAVAAWRPSFLHQEKTKIGKRNEQRTENQRLLLTPVTSSFIE
jgi:hypothetical protein